MIEDVSHKDILNRLISVEKKVDEVHAAYKRK